jgi:hypothetical protein
VASPHPRAGLDLFLKRKSLAPAGNRTLDLPTCNLDVTRLTLSDPVFVLEIKLSAITGSTQYLSYDWPDQN